MGSTRVGLNFPELKVSRYCTKFVNIISNVKRLQLSVYGYVSRLWHGLKGIFWSQAKVLCLFGCLHKVLFKNWMESIMEFIMCLFPVMRALEMFVLKRMSSRTSTLFDLIVIEDFDNSFDFISISFISSAKQETSIFLPMVRLIFWISSWFQGLTPHNFDQVNKLCIYLIQSYLLCCSHHAMSCLTIYGVSYQHHL